MSKMRSLFFLTFVVESYSLCGKGPVDLSRMPAFEVHVDCPGNRDQAGIEMGCVKEIKPGRGGDQTQTSNTFYIDPCGTTKRDECPDIPAGAAGVEVTVDINKSDKTKPIKTCYSLGQKQGAEFKLIDEDNPDEGITATYTGGSTSQCPQVQNKDKKYETKKRDLTVHYHCSLQNNDMYNDVDEPGGDARCSYSLHRNTIHACPKYCITGNKICNGNGICGHGDEPCLCYEGYVGKYCETPGYAPSTPPEGFTIAAVLLTVGLFLLGGLLAFLVYMWLKLRRLAPVDTEAYSTLTSKFNELGQIT